MNRKEETRHAPGGCRSRRVAGTRRWVRASSALFAVSLATGPTLVAQAASGQTEPFKLTNIHFETNASACDMGIQIKFDTEGITDGTVTDPTGRKVYGFGTKGGMRATGGQAEGFLEGVEPQITELLAALGCEPAGEEGETSLEGLFEAWPAGDYTFKGKSKSTKFADRATLTHAIPAGPEVVAPAHGAVVPDAPLLIDWNPVTDAILPSLGPVNIVGYHVTVEEQTGAEGPPQLDVDLPSSETSLTVPAEFLKPNTVYKFEVFATEEGSNQTFTEGLFCTAGVANCVAPE